MNMIKNTGSNKYALSIIMKIFKVHKVKFMLFLLFVIITGTSPVIDSVILKSLVDKVSTITTDNNFFVLLMWAAGYALWWEFVNISYRIIDILYLKMVPVVKGSVASYLYDTIQKYEYSFFQNNPSGDITNYITEAARSLEMIFSLSIENILRQMILIIGTYFAIASVHPLLSVVYLIWLMVFFTINLFIVNRMGKYARFYSKTRATLSGKLVDVLFNISNVRMANAYKKEQNYINGYVEQSVVADQKMRLSLIFPHYLLGLTCNLLIFFIVLFLGNLKSQGKITVGDFALVLSLCTAVSYDLWTFAQDLGDLFEEFNNFKQSLSSLIKPADNNKKTATTSELIVNKGEIQFKDVSFSYQLGKRLFYKKNFIMSGKQKIGLVGFSGSGKTTLINLICKLYPIESGEILIDGQNIANVSDASLRRNLSIIPQNPTLFNRSIRENLTYGIKNVSDEDMYEASKKAYIHDFIISLPDQYDTLCLEQGSNLSGGQKQRIAIARAILKNAPILILDEATSALDSVTEQQIQKSLDLLMQDRTVLVIAHRLGTVVDMDRILVFHEGVIVEDGQHEELIKKQDGLYQKLWQLQIGGKLPNLG